LILDVDNIINRADGGRSASAAAETAAAARA
jgi:hypothetical protein